MIIWGGMGQTNSIVLLLILAAIIAAIITLSFRRGMVDVLIEALNSFRGGGPPTPMHPSPANDAVILRRQARKTKN